MLERAAHNDFMYAALDASRAAQRIDQEYINPRDRKSTPWADQQWNMKKVATEAAHILLGMRQDIQAKYHHGRAPPGDWADMPDRDDYMVRSIVSDPNHRTYNYLQTPKIRATLLNAQTGQCIPLDDPTGAGGGILASAGGDDHNDCIARGLCPWARVAYAYVPPSADGGDGNAGEVAEILQRAERSRARQTVGYRAFQHDSRSPCSGVADYPNEGADARHPGADSC